MKEFTLRVVTDNATIMTRIEQGFDGVWDAQGLRKAAAALKGMAEMLEA